MADYTIKDIRNIALISHAGSGKTSFAEAIVYNAGASNRFGKVDDGTTVSDYSEDEIERKVSISASILSFKYGGKRVNIIDSPGYADFMGEMLSALNAADSAVLLVDAHDGIQVGTEKTWSMASDIGLAQVIFLNKLDKENVNFYAVVDYSGVARNFLWRGREKIFREKTIKISLIFKIFNILKIKVCKIA